MATTRPSATPALVSPLPAEAAAQHQAAMSYLLLASLELARCKGVPDQAFEFASKALDAIATLRIIVSHGRA